MTDMSLWNAKFRYLADKYSSLSPDLAVTYHCAAPAALKDVTVLEKELGSLPPSLKAFFLTVSGYLYFRVEVPESASYLPKAFSGATYGIYLSLERVRHAEKARDMWWNDVYKEDFGEGREAATDLEQWEYTQEYSRLWRDCLGFLNLTEGHLPDFDQDGLVPEDEWEGDVLAFDLSSADPEPPVIYLSHDGASCHGQVLGHNFVDFMERLLSLGGFGATEDGRDLSYRGRNASADEWRLHRDIKSPMSFEFPEAIELRKILDLK